MEVVKQYVTYQDVHSMIGETAKKIQNEFQPDMMIAIGGGGFFPARVMRTFLKVKGKNVPILAIGLSLYESLPDLDDGTGTAQAEQLGKEVVRTQWLDHSTLGNHPLRGKKILIVDEVDDSRTTLDYAIRELKKDVEDQLAALSEAERAQVPKTEFGIFVVHNKLKEKAGALPEDVKYWSGADVGDDWICYPWESQNIAEHDQLAAEAKARKASGSL